MARALGQLWAAGVDVSWKRLYDGEARHRIPLPRYPFERKSYWIDADPKSPSSRCQTHRAAVPDQAGRHGRVALRPVVDTLVAARPAGVAALGGHLARVRRRGGAGRRGPAARRSDVRRAGDRRGTPRRLELGTPGDVDSLSLEPAGRQAPEPGEVEIRVHAAALQFKDVLMALGMYADEPVPMGAECAGTVVRVGEGVSDFKVGDEVLAAGFDSFQDFVTRDARRAVHKPASLRFEDAVTIPSGFLTAYHSLIRVADLQPGERVLIHAASGGVGQSAVQIAQMAGAEVFGTAGSPRKRDFLREELGIEHVYDSRSLDFADGIMADMGGEGIDVVLNSLTDEAIVKGLEILRPHGRFVELGKKDLYEDGNLPDVPNRDTIDYTIIDMDVEREERTDAFQALFREVMDHIEAGRLKPLPRSVFPWEEASDAFQYMSQTKHIGKVVLALRALPPTTVRVTPGASLEQVDARHFTIRPGHPEDYAALLEAIDTDELRHVVHAWNVTPAEDERAEATFWREEQDRAFYSLFHLGKALTTEAPDEPLPISVLSNDMQRVSDEAALRPSKATLLGPCRVIPHEFPTLRCRSIDVEGKPDNSGWADRLVEDLASELLAPSDGATVAYRGMDRWVQGVEPASIEKARRPAARVREGGVYLITGGLGGVSLQVAEHLARSKPVTLVLTSRSGLPPREEWKDTLSERASSDPLRKRIERVLALEAYGAEVVVGTADVTDRSAMNALVNDVQARYGAIDGVIHAAGVVDDDLLPLKDPEAAARVLAPKVDGTLVLDEVLDDAPLDFFVLFSSVSALVGLPGQIDYTAANAFLDAFAQRKRAVDGVPALSINWSAWQEVGMAAAIAAGDETDSEGAPTAHPLLGRRLSGDDDVTFASILAPRNHWILDGHRNTRGEAILPGTGYLELARAAFAEATDHEAMALRDVYFVAPLEIRGRNAAPPPRAARIRNRGHGPLLSRASKSRAKATRRAGTSTPTVRWRRSRTGWTTGLTSGRWPAAAHAASRPLALTTGRARKSTYASGRGGAASARCATATARRWPGSNCPRCLPVTCSTTPCTRRCSTWPPASGCPSSTATRSATIFTCPSRTKRSGCTGRCRVGSAATCVA